MHQITDKISQQLESLRQSWHRASPQQQLTFAVLFFLAAILPLSLMVIQQSTELRRQAQEVPISVPQGTPTNTPPISVCASPPTCGPDEVLVISGSPEFLCQTYFCQPQGSTPTLIPINSPTPTIMYCDTSIGSKPADFNNDGRVDLWDYSMLIREFLKVLPVYLADANCDHKVDLTDYSLLVRDFLK